jgi:hypothetical protein
MPAQDNRPKLEQNSIKPVQRPEFAVSSPACQWWANSGSESELERHDTTSTVSTAMQTRFSIRMTNQKIWTREELLQFCNLPLAPSATHSNEVRAQQSQKQSIMITGRCQWMRTAAVSRVASATPCMAPEIYISLVPVPTFCFSTKGAFCTVPICLKS